MGDGLGRGICFVKWETVWEKRCSFRKVRDGLGRGVCLAKGATVLEKRCLFRKQVLHL